MRVPKVLRRRKRKAAAGEAFVHEHQSGKFSATAAQWVSAVDEATDGADVTTFTETPIHHPPAPKGKRRVYVGAHAPDVASYVDTSTVSLEGATGVEVASTRYKLGGSKLKPTLKVLVERLRMKLSDLCVGFLVIHEPSAIESEVAAHGQASRFPRIKALFQSFAGIHEAKRHLRRTYGIKVFVLVGDFNLDWHKLWVRVMFHLRFPGLACSFTELPVGAGPHGDLGNRLISLSFYSRRHLTTTGSKLGKRRAGFDHLPFRTTYRFKRRRK